MTSTTRTLRRYDHRLRDLVRSTEDISHATRRGVPCSTARGWLTATRADVVTLDVLDTDLRDLQHELLALRQRVERLVAVLRLVVVLVRVSGASLAYTRLPDAAVKVSLLRAIERSRAVLPLRAVLRVLRLSQSRYRSWKREDTCGLDDLPSCPRSSPQQLTQVEVETIREMVMSTEYRHVPTGTLALLAERLRKVFASPTTWHRLVRRHRWRRPRLRVHPAKPTVGIRASDDERLCGGQIISATAIAHALEDAEIAVKPEVDAALDADDADDDAAEVASYVDDDLIAELAWNQADGEADFIVYNRHGETVTRSTTVQTAIGPIIPPTCCKGLVTPGYPTAGTVYVPTEYDETGLDEGQLRAEVMAYVHRYVELPGETAAMAVEYVSLTWVFDAFDELPYLAFRTADAGRGKSRALNVVGGLCYRPIFCGGGSTAAATLRLLDVFGGTLLADEFDQRDTELSAEITKIVNQGFERNRPLVRCDGESNAPRPFRCFGPKVFCFRRGFSDDASESRTLSVRMKQRTRRDVPINLPRHQSDPEALRLRNRLLAWRFGNLGRVKISPDDADLALEGRFNQIGLPLMAIAGSAGRARVVKALLDSQNEVAARRSDSLAAEVFAVAAVVADDNGLVRPGAVVTEVNRRRAVVLGVEVDKLRKPLTPQKCGHILGGDLELPRLPKDRDGARYELTETRRAELAKRYGDTLSETSQTSKRHTSPETSPENPRSSPKNGDCDVGDVGDVLPGMDGATSPETSPEPEPARDEDNSDFAERKAIMDVEREAELEAEVATFRACAPPVESAEVEKSTSGKAYRVQEASHPFDGISTP